MPIRPFPWQLKSAEEYNELNDKLESEFGIRVIWHARDCKGRSKAMDKWHCYPVGRGRADKLDREGKPYTILGSLPPSKTMCSVCWMEGILQRADVPFSLRVRLEPSVLDGSAACAVA